MFSNKNIFMLVFMLILGGSVIKVQGADKQENETIFKEEDASFSLLSEVKSSDAFVRLKNLTQHIFAKTEYGEILICKKPLKDKPVILTKEYLEKLFIAKGMDDKTLYLMDIPAEVKVSCMELAFENKTKVSATGVNDTNETTKANPLTEIDSSEILLRVSNYIDQQLRKNEPQVSLYQSYTNSNWKVKVPEDYDLKVLPGVIIKSNSVTAKVGVYYKNALVDSKVFNFRADIFVNALVANINLEKGQIIKKGNFSMQLAPYNTNVLSSIRDEKALIGFEVQKNVKVGEGLDNSDLNTPILINRGSSINIIVKEEGFSIRAVGIAQETGRIGDQILVSMKNNDAKIKCIVTGSNTVDIIK
jgi:flagella basal body P-ring formation protein FlgA